MNKADAATLGDEAWAAGPCVAIQLVGASAQATWASLATSFGCFAASDAAATTLQQQFFSKAGLASARASTAVCNNCTTCIIKPHAVAAGSLGPLLHTLLGGVAGLKVTAIEMFDIDLVAAEEFLEVYKGVVQEYSVRYPPC